MLTFSFSILIHASNVTFVVSRHWYPGAESGQQILRDNSAEGFNMPYSNPQVSAKPPNIVKQSF